MNNVTSHIDDDADLYALGALDADERATVDRHLATCSACRARVGEAEATVHALALEYHEIVPPVALDRRISQRFERRAPAYWWTAVAAALLIGLLPSVPLVLEHTAQQHANTQRDAAAIALLNSHFAHAQFVAIGASGLPSSKVIFARNRDWMYVMVSGSHAYDVEGVLQNGSAVPLGVTVPTGSTTSQLFLQHAPAGVEHVILRQNGIAIGTARVLTPKSIEGH